MKFMVVHDKNLSIEVLRAYAIAITIAAHIYVLSPTQLTFGQRYWLGGGVDLFFCISGFLITGSLLKRDRAPGLRIYLKGFLVRRCMRLMPAAIVCSTLTLIVSQTFVIEDVFGPHEAVLESWFWGVLNLENLYIWLLNQPAPPTPLWHYWSLSLEEQFYLILAVALFFTKDRRWLIVPFLAFAVFQTTKIRPWGTFLWFTRSDALLYGSLLALVMHYYWKPEKLAFSMGQKKAASWLFLVLLPFPVVLSQPALSPYYMGWVAMAASMLVALSVTQLPVIPRGKFLEVALYIGSRSYSIYLFHNPIICLFQKVATQPALQSLMAGYGLYVLILLTILTTLGVSELSYRYIETPFRVAGQRWSSKIDTRSSTKDVPQLS
jgi:peptidoglycan/LPS O-acetylase OafA/YrhL